MKANLTQNWRELSSLEEIVLVRLSLEPTSNLFPLGFISTDEGGTYNGIYLVACLSLVAPVTRDQGVFTSCTIS